MMPTAILSFAIATLASTVCAQQDPDPAVPGPMATPRGIVFAKAADRRLVIDGSLQDWPEVPMLRLDDSRQVSGTALGTFRGAKDCSAQAFTLWDEKNFYFAAKVKDDRHLYLTAKTPQRTEFPPSDAIELSFDPRRDTRAIGADPGRSEDVTFWLGDSEDAGKAIIRWDRLRGTARLAEGGRIVVERDDESGVTTYEARIPWFEILPADEGAKAGSLLDVSFVVNDFDVPLDPMPDTRVGWTFGTGLRIDPGLYGTLKLSKRTARREGQSFELPEFPSPSTPEAPAVPGRAHWVAMLQELGGLPPVPTTQLTTEPGFVAGKERKAWLDRYEGFVSAFPRADFLRLQMCANRRMVRECAGMITTGLPFAWDLALRRIDRAAERDSPERGFRLLRLPQGGWLVRSKQASFLIDPAGFAVEKYLWRWCDFALFTAPNEVLKRNDQLLTRMLAAEPLRRPYLHIAQALPGVESKDLELAVPGEKYEVQGLEITVLGAVDERGWVTATVGYHVRWPDGSTLVVSGRDALSEQVPPGEVDVLLLSAKHPRGVPFGHRVPRRMIVVDEVLEVASQPGPQGRITLAEVFALQAKLRPNRSILLAPTESIESATDWKSL